MVMTTGRDRTKRDKHAVVVVVCFVCGSRLQRNEEPDLLEIGSDSLRATARHRCVPPVEAAT
jgi:hypothetical protein